MPSWQSYLVHPFLRFYVKRRLKRAASPLAARAILGHPMPPLPDACFTPDTLGGLPGEWTHGQSPPEATVLYLHGGGYFTCSPRTHRSITSAYALRGFSVYAPDYRRAPEHPFPAAVDDALAAYRALLAQTAPARLIIAGNSAGGGLALAVLLAARAQNLPLPSCAILFSPWTDLACTGASLGTNLKRDSMLYAPRIAEAAANYLAGAAAQNPLASPLYGDFTGLPPLLIQVSEMEILLDDATRLAARARAAGVEVTLTIWRNLPHVWQVSQVLLPEARQALDEAARFANPPLHLSRPQRKCGPPLLPVGIGGAKPLGATTVKPSIHPDYHEINIIMTDGTEFKTRSCMGKEGDTLRLDIDPKSHPAWTGVQRIMDTGGQVAKFNKRFASIGTRKA